tara:strand:- start:1959 stop:2510 length:552 start_codon:yes stop_codon:yes gene_type:complete
VKIFNTKFKGLFILEPDIYKDERGYFMETYNSLEAINFLGNIKFVQHNESKSKKGVLRGLHFQTPPYSQSKLIRCIDGNILDIALDIRKNSTTYGKYASTLLSNENKRQLFVPKGFAHGFIVLSDSATVLYKVDCHYNPKHEAGILWKDPYLNIDWKVKKSDIIVSKKDSSLLPLSKINNPFL